MSIEEVPSSSSSQAATLTYVQIAVLGLSFCSGVLLARLLGPYGRGVFSIAFVPSQLLVSLAGGASDATLYFLSRERQARPQILNVMLVYVGAASCVVLAFLGLLFALTNGSLLRNVPFPVYAIAAGSVPFALWLILAQSYLFALHRTRASQVGVLTERFITTCGLAIIWIVGSGLYSIVTLVTSSIAVASLVATWQMGFRDVLSAARAPVERARLVAVIRYSRSIALANTAQKLTYRLDQLIINVIAGPATVGIYAVSARLAEVALVVPRAFRLTWAADRARLNDISASATETLGGGRKLTVLMLIALPVYGAVAVALIPPVYGDAFSGSVVPFVFLLGGAFAISQSLAYVAALTGAKKLKALALVSWIGAATTIALDLVLVPSAGATGAAVASLVAYAVFAVGILVAWHRLVGRDVRLVEHIPRRSDFIAVSRILLERIRTTSHRT